MRSLAAAAIAASLAVGLAGSGVNAQSRARIFDVVLGSPVGALPADEWVDPACGTNGGPPSTPLERFDGFAACPIEAATGLREVWFIYDDEWEYIARSYRDPVQIGRYSDNTFYGQPIITSLLVDDAGLVQGYRVVTDPRAPPDTRREAYLLFSVFKTLFGDVGWRCTELPRDEREAPMEGAYLKTDCDAVIGDRFVRVEGRLFRKPGQDALEVAPIGYFESQARLEVYAMDVVRGRPCCPG